MLAVQLSRERDGRSIRVVVVALGGTAVSEQLRRNSDRRRGSLM